MILDASGKRTLVSHVFEPVYDKNSKALVLGTMPSPKSREYGFYYGHPQNRFWAVMEAVFGVARLNSIEEKKSFLHENGIALWDVLRSCEITGADDNSIRNPICNDFTEIISNSHIKTVFTTGMKATNLYAKYCFDKTHIPAVYLPSTSPANRSIGFQELVDRYGAVLKAATNCQ